MVSSGAEPVKPPGANESPSAPAASAPPASKENNETINTPDYFLWEIEALDKRVKAKKKADRISPVDAQRLQDYWEKRAKSRGIDLSEHSLSRQTPTRRLLADPSLVNSNETELNELAKAFEEIDALAPAEEAVKKKWLRLIEKTLELQKQAKENVAKFTVYVLRCQQTNNILHMSEIHLDWFKTWADPEHNNSAIEAPPGTGKTTCLYGQELWDFKEDQCLRILRQSGNFDTASKRMGVVRTYIQLRRYRAVAPGVRIDFSKPSNSKRFTLVRQNIGSQDPSMEAAGAETDFQGSGFERLDMDDLCSDKLRYQASKRTQVWGRLHGTTLKRIRDYDTSRARYIATPWHVDDPTSRLRKAIDCGEMVGWIAKQYPRQHDEKGLPLPLMLRADWANHRVSLINQQKNDPITYACCEKLNPKDEVLRRLKKVVYYDVSGGTDELCPEVHRKYYGGLLKAIKAGEQWQVLDPAAGGADRTGMIGFSLSRREDGFKTAAITSARFFSNTSDVVAEEIRKVVTAENSDRVLMEAAALGKGVVDMWTLYLTSYLGPDYKHRVKQTGTQLRDKRGNPTGANVGKRDRWFAAVPFLTAGVIMVPGKWQYEKYHRYGAKLVPCDEAGLRELNSQMFGYPDSVSSGRDDGIDCVSMFINYHAHRLAASIESLRKSRTEDIEKPTFNPLTIARREMERQRQEKLKLQAAMGPPGVREMESRLLMAAS